MAGWMTRAQWAGSAQSPAQGVMSGTPRGVAVHWIGPGAWLARGNSDPAALMRQIRGWHTQQAKADFAYSLAVNGNGIIIEGRNTPQRPRVRPGSNGSSATNNSHYSVVLLTGENDPAPSDVMIAAAGRAVAWLRANGGAGPAVVGHRDLHPTACPGNQIQATLGRISAAAQPGGDDDMTPAQATQLAEVHWMLGQVRGTDLPPIQQSTGGRLLAPVDQTRWLVGESINPAIHAIGQRLSAIEEALGIPVQTTVMPTMPQEVT